MPFNTWRCRRFCNTSNGSRKAPVTSLAGYRARFRGGVRYVCHIASADALKGSRRNKIFTSPSAQIAGHFHSLQTSARAQSSLSTLFSVRLLYIIKMAAAASSDIFSAFPSFAAAATTAAAAFPTNILASTAYGCPEVGNHPSSLSILHGVSNCKSRPEFPQHCIVSPLTAATTPVALVEVYCCLVVFLTLFTMRRVEGANHTPVRLRLLGSRVSAVL